MQTQSIATFKVLTHHTPDGVDRFGRHYVLVLNINEPAKRYHLIVYRGSSIRPTFSYPEVFESAEVLLRNARQKINRRVRHGYTLVWWDPDFPLLDWMQQRGVPIQRAANYIRPGVQLPLRGI